MKLIILLCILLLVGCSISNKTSLPGTVVNTRRFTSLPLFFRVDSDLCNSVKITEEVKNILLEKKVNVMDSATYRRQYGREMNAVFANDWEAIAKGVAKPKTKEQLEYAMHNKPTIAREIRIFDRSCLEKNPEIEIKICDNPNYTITHNIVIKDFSTIDITKVIADTIMIK